MPLTELATNPEADATNAELASRFGGEIRNGWVYGMTVLGQAADAYVADGRAFAQTKAGGAYSSQELSAFVNMTLCPGAPLHISQVTALKERQPAANDNKPAKPLITVHQYALRGTAAIPRREFIYGKHLIRKYVSAQFAAGGLGKSSLLTTEALAMATGKDLLGHKPEQPLRVWLINAEDPREEMERKVEATAAHHSLSDKDVGGRLFLSSGRESSFVVAVEDKGVKVQAPVVNAITEHAELHGFDVIIVDPFVSTHQVNENDNAAIQSVAATWTMLADQLGCAIELAHHVVKGANEVTEDSGRGAGALKDKARAVRALNRMTHSEADKWGIAPADRFGYFRSDMVKANLAKAGAGSEWFRFVEVPMGNGLSMQKPQDFTGVVERWTPPRKDPADEDADREATRQALLATVSDEHLAIFKVRLANGSFKHSDQATLWAGKELAAVTGLDPQADKAHIKALIEAWIVDGELKKVILPDGHRRDAPHVKPGCGTTKEVPQM